MKWPIRAGVGQVEEHGGLQALAPERSPEPLDLAQGLGMPRCGHDLADAALRELLVQGALAPPGHVLSAIVGEHLLGGTVGGDARAEDLQHQCR